MTSILIGLLIGLCLGFAGFLTVLKVAFIKITMAEIVYHESKSSPQAALLRKLLPRQDKVISALLFGYFFFVLSAVIVMTRFIFTEMSPLHSLIYIILMKFFIGLVTWALPRSFALKQPLDFLFSMASCIQVAYRIFTGPALGLAWLTRKVVSLFNTGFSHSATLFETTDYQGLVGRHQDQIILKDKDYLIQRGLERFSSLPVNKIMIPVSDLKVMDAAMPVEELLPEVFASSATRILLYQDKPENIIGVLHTRLLMKSFCLAEGDVNGTDITSAISEPVFIAENVSVLDQLENFSKRHEQFALVNDTRGNLKGAVGLDNIMDALSRELRNHAVDTKDTNASH